MNWRFELIVQINGTWPKSLLCEWFDLAENGEYSHVFFHPDMAEAWVETYKPLRRIEPFVIRAIWGENVAILPMVKWHKNWKNAFQTVIVPIGYSDFDYHDPIFKYQPDDKETAAFWADLTDFLKKGFACDSIVIDGITDRIACGNLEWKRGEICPLMKLDGINSESDLMSFFKTSLRGDIRRQIRRLEEIAPLSFKEYPSWDSIPAETFNKFMIQHSQRWPNAYKAPLFHENMLRIGLEAGIVHFSTLSVGNTEIAWHLGFSFRGRYYYYMPAGNQDYLKFSPTKIHMFYLVRRAVLQGYAIYDHLRGEENYKSGWSNDSQYVNHSTIQSERIISKMKINILKFKSLLS